MAKTKSSKRKVQASVVEGEEMPNRDSSPEQDTDITHENGVVFDDGNTNNTNTNPSIKELYEEGRSESVVDNLRNQDSVETVINQMGKV